MDPSRTDPAAHDDGDPLRQLEDWGRQVDRRLRRVHAGRRLWHRLTWPGRVVVRRPGMTIAVVLVLALSGGLGAATWLGHGSLPDRVGADTRRAYPTETPAAGVFATTSATADPAGPFASTPAAHWAEGEAGISTPAPIGVNGFTEAEVAAHLASVKQGMVAARLDHRMLVDHDPSALLTLIAPSGRTYLAEQLRAGELLGLVTLVEGGAHLGKFAPRVSGRTSFASTKDANGRTILDVVTNYVWAYGFDNDEVVLVHDEVHWYFYRVGDVRGSDLGLRVGSFRGYVWNVDCAVSNRGLIAPAKPDDSYAPTSPDPENPDNYYQPDHALDVPGSCGEPTPSPISV